MKTLEEIKEIVIKHREEFEKKFKVKRIDRFCSYVRGEQKENRY